MSSEIKCVVCGEPYEAYGVNHGDMLPWQAKLFKEGAGCPSCEGVEPEEPWEPRSIFDIDNGDGDPAERLNLIENRAKRPKWEKPTNFKLIYQCACCKTKVMEDPYPDLPEDKLVLEGGRVAEEYKLNRMSDEEVLDPAKLGKDGSVIVCPACVETCDNCGCEMCGEISTDIYDGLASFPAEQCGGRWGDAVCIDCFERLSSEMESEETEVDDADENDESNDVEDSGAESSTTVDPGTGST